METLLSVCLGVGLAAACGFRIFVPLLAVNLAARAGMMDLTAGFDWLASTPTLIVFAVATVLEIAAYYVPWVDNLLDTAASPLAVVAGVVVAASVFTDMSPLLRWSLALIAGGSAAGVVQGLTSLTRGTSSLATGGLGNFVVASAELIGSVIMSLLSLLLPLIAGMVVFILLVVAVRWYFGRRGRARRPVEASP